MQKITNEEKQDLIKAAIKGLDKAYAPYSKFKVGAAVLGVDGKTYIGCNIENVSYGLTNCGERTAIFKMVSEGCLQFKALAVVTYGEVGDGAPCGACRQVIGEFCEDMDTTPIIVGNEKGEYKQYTPIQLFPQPFLKFEPNE